MELDRREFLRFSTAAFAGLALSGCVLKKLIEADEADAPWSPGPESWIPSVCQQCPGGCGITVRVIDGRAIKIDGLPFHPINRGRLCAVGQAGLQVLYDPDRIKGPMKRIGGRGSSKWQSLSWDEAIQTVTEKLAEIRGRGEPHTVVMLAGQPRGLMDKLLMRFLAAYGSPNYVRSGCDGTAKAVLATQGIDTLVGYDLENSNFILSFGYSLLETGWSPVLAHRMYGYLRQERPGTKAKIVQVEPRLSMTAAKADRWIPINPGTDGALALGLAHVIVREGLYDREFIEKATFGFEDWRDGDGASHLGFKSVVLKDYRLDEVSTITGVPIQTIIRLAKGFAVEKPSVAIGERGASMHTNGLYTRMAIHSLNALVGSIDVPGGVVLPVEVPLRSWPPVEGDAIARKGRSMPRIDRAGTALFPFASHVFSQVPQGILGRDPYQVNALFLYYTNPIYSAPGAVGFAKAFETVPFIVSFSPFMDESTEHADLILPDHTYLERWQDDPVLPVMKSPVLGIRRPVVTPLYDTRHTGDVILAIAKAMGGKVAAAFPWDSFERVLKDAAEGVFHAAGGTLFTSPFEEVQIQALGERGWRPPTFKSFDEFWKALLERGGWWEPAYRFSGGRRLFKTASGRFEFYSQHVRRTLERVAGGKPVGDLLKNLGVAARGDRAYLPHYEPPRFIGEEQDYPFHLNTYKPVTHAGGRGASQPHLQEVSAPPVGLTWDSWIEVNPKAAKRLGIADGEWVWVESPLGKVRTRARLHPGALPNVVNMPVGRGHKAYGRWAQGRGENPNQILGGQRDGLGGFFAWHSTRVRLSKA
jgi:anaerobic selenocysteine-containing dehydrogenase